MTVKELKKIIAYLPDNMKVGGIGHFGEFLEVLDAEIRTVSEKKFTTLKENIFCIVIENAGDEPD